MIIVRVVILFVEIELDNKISAFVLIGLTNAAVLSN